MGLAVPSGSNAATLADWAELLVLTTEGESVSVTRLGRLLRGEGSDAAEEELEVDAGPDPDEDGEQDLELPLVDEGRGELEVRVEQLLDEIAVRLSLGPKVYPFERKAERVVRRPAPGEHAYLLLLALSWKGIPARGEKRMSEVEAAFDALALEALGRYLGRGARGLRFAKNAHDPEDNATRPKKFREAIAWLREELKLAARRTPPDDEFAEHWEDEGQAPPDGRKILNSYEDAGVDVVVWWRFGDQRAGSPVLLAQCTVQLEWGEKVSDIDVSLWDKWIDFATVPPQTALVIPFAVNRSSETWNDRTVTAGVIVDRHRLLELLNELEDEALEAMPDEETRAWVAKELAAAA